MGLFSMHACLEFSEFYFDLRTLPQGDQDKINDGQLFSCSGTNMTQIA